MRITGFSVLLSVSGLAVGAGLLAAPAATAGAPAMRTHYYTAKPLCPAPTPGRDECFAMERVNATKSTPGAHAVTLPAALSLGPAGGYTPGEIATAYGVNPAGGAGQVIGLVEAYNDPTALSDLDTFDAQYGLSAETTTGSAPSFEKVNATGGDPSSLPTAVGTGWDGEETLDMEAARGLCHGCRIIMVEVASNAPADLAAGVDEVVALGATVVSNSWGQPDVAPTTADRLAFNADFDHPGVPILDATGDLGWYGWTQANNNGTPVNEPFTPATLPTVVAVGGTTLTLNADGSRAAETVWNEVGASDHAETGGGASSGGCSLPGYYTAPFWQQAMANFASLGCGTGRSATDVAVDADASTGYDIYQSSSGAGHWYTTGGTSLSSPLLAAMWADAGGGHGVTYPAASLYANLVHHPSSFFDVTVGGNSLCNEDAATCASDWDIVKFGGVATNPNTLYNGKYYYIDCAAVPNADGAQSTNLSVVANENQCFATPGFDGASGVGVPQGPAAFAKPTVTAAISGPVSIHKRTATLAAHGLSDTVPGGTVSSVGWSFGDGSSLSTGVTQHHTFRKAGTFRVTLVATDSVGSTSSPVVKTISIGKHPSVKASAPKKLHKKKEGSFKAKAKDLNTSGKIKSIVWSWGHGKHSKGGSVKHAFTKSGTYKVGLKVTDNQGNVTSKTFKVHVKS